MRYISDQMSAHDNLRGHMIVSHVIFITADWLTFVSALTNLTPFQDIDRIICGILAILSVCICKCVCVCVCGRIIIMKPVSIETASILIVCVCEGHFDSL